MSFFDPNTGNSAEDAMSKAFGCIVVVVVVLGLLGIAAAVAIIKWIVA